MTDGQWLPCLCLMTTVSLWLMATPVVAWCRSRSVNGWWRWLLVRQSVVLNMGVAHMPAPWSTWNGYLVGGQAVNHQFLRGTILNKFIGKTMAGAAACPALDGRAHKSLRAAGARVCSRLCLAQRVSRRVCAGPSSFPAAEKLRQAHLTNVALHLVAKHATSEQHLQEDCEASTARGGQWRPQASQCSDWKIQSVAVCRQEGVLQSFPKGPLHHTVVCSLCQNSLSVPNAASFKLLLKPFHAYSWLIDGW